MSGRNVSTLYGLGECYDTFPNSINLNSYILKLNPFKGLYYLTFALQAFCVMQINQIKFIEGSFQIEKHFGMI